MEPKQLSSASLFIEFVKSEKTGGIILILCTVISLILANSTASEGYIHFWHIHWPFFVNSLNLDLSAEHWINDGLMALFFLLTGLEIKRELLDGALSDFKSALLPAIAAIGGMLVPAAVHYLFNHGTAAQAGIGIPMATDIAFSLGVLALLGKKVPASVKIFLTALAIIDDLGAVIIIAIFYTSSFSALYLLLALAVFGLLLILNKMNVLSLWVYCIAGLFIWYFMFRSGIHATLSGVLLAFAVPYSKGDKKNPSAKLQHLLHYPVNLLIVPIFALANTAIHMPAGWHADLLSDNSLGIGLGLILGKPLGIFFFCVMAIGFKWSKLPAGMRTIDLLGTGALAGIGFTMSIFISNLAFKNNTAMVEGSKIAVLIASLLSAVSGAGILLGFRKK